MFNFFICFILNCNEYCIRFKFHNNEYQVVFTTSNNEFLEQEIFETSNKQFYSKVNNKGSVTSSKQKAKRFASQEMSKSKERLQIAHFINSINFQSKLNDYFSWQSNAKSLTRSGITKNLILTHSMPTFHFYTTWIRQKTSGFLMFSLGKEMKDWREMG